MHSFFFFFCCIKNDLRGHCEILVRLGTSDFFYFKLFLWRFLRYKCFNIYYESKDLPEYKKEKNVPIDVLRKVQSLK